MLSVMTLLAITAGAPIVHRPTEPIEKGFLLKSLRHNDADHRYVLYVPHDYDPARKWPTIVFLHGMGECGTDGLKQVGQGIGTAIMANAAKWPFIVVMPQKPDPRHAWGEHAEMVAAMLDATAAHYAVDPDRVYLTGLSQGGNGTWAIAARWPERWAAIAPICGYGNPEEFAPKLKSMPIWCFHGEADPVVPSARSVAIVDAIKAQGGSPRLTLYPGIGHNAWDKAYRDEPLAAWFLEHRRNADRPPAEGAKPSDRR